MSNAKVFYEKDYVRASVSNLMSGNDPRFDVVTVERLDGTDALGAARWTSEDVGEISRHLAYALRGEQENCKRLAAEQHAAKMRAELAEINLRKMRAAVKRMLLGCTDMTRPGDEGYDSCPAPLVQMLEELLCADGNGGQVDLTEVIP